MPDLDEHEDNIYEDEKVELSDNDPPEDKVRKKMEIWREENY